MTKGEGLVEQANTECIRVRVLLLKLLIPEMTQEGTCDCQTKQLCCLCACSFYRAIEEDTTVQANKGKL